MKSFKDHLAEYGDSLSPGIGPSRIRKAMSASPEKDPRQQPAGQGKFTQRDLDWANATTKNNIRRRIGTHPTPTLPEGALEEDWGSSDTTAAMKIMWDTINSEFDGKLSIESMTAAAERAAETYQESIGLEFKEATDAFLGHFMRRADGVAAERHQKTESSSTDPNSSWKSDARDRSAFNGPAAAAETYFKLTSPRAKTLMQDMRDVGELQSLNAHGEVMSASAEDVSALRSKLIQNGQIDAFEAVVEESTPVPASQGEIDEVAKPPAKRKGYNALSHIRDPGTKEYTNKDYTSAGGDPWNGADSAGWISGAEHGYKEGYAAGVKDAQRDFQPEIDNPDSGIMPGDSPEVQQLIRQGR